jgi:hypothetical protein
VVELETTNKKNTGVREILVVVKNQDKKNKKQNLCAVVYFLKKIGDMSAEIFNIERI